VSGRAGVADAMDAAPIFPVSNLEVALAHHRCLGFMTSTYEGGGCGVAVRDGAAGRHGVGAA
jgi:hypothetical protein